MGLGNIDIIQSDSDNDYEEEEDQEIYIIKCGCCETCFKDNHLYLKDIKNKEVFFACKEGDIQTLNRIRTINIKDFEKNVFFAANENHFNVVKFLFEQIPEKKYEDIYNKYDDFGWIEFAFVRCAVEGYDDILTFFIELGVDVEQPFLASVNKQNIESVKILWSSGKIDFDTIKIAIENTANTMNIELFNLLISYKEAKEKESQGPLIGHKYKPLKEYLSDCILNSCIQGHIEFFKYFLYMYEDLYDFDFNDIADEILRRISVSKNKEKIELVNNMYEMDNIPTLNICLIGACRSGQSDLIEEYLKLGANDFDNALIACVIDGNIGNILKFVELGAKVTLRSVIYASIRSYEKIFKFLLVKYKKSYETSLQELYFKDYILDEEEDDIRKTRNWPTKGIVKDQDHENKLAMEKDKFDCLIQFSHTDFYPDRINEYEYSGITYAEYNDIGFPEVISDKKLKKGTIKNIMYYAKLGNSTVIIDILKKELEESEDPEEEQEDPEEEQEDPEEEQEEESDPIA